MEGCFFWRVGFLGGLGFCAIGVPGGRGFPGGEVYLKPIQGSLNQLIPRDGCSAGQLLAGIPFLEVNQTRVGQLGFQVCLNEKGRRQTCRVMLLKDRKCGTECINEFS